jgi:UDP-GlcNAc:undecaprenyl-phosphate/decaprenyl-phosphate GlcNAc-1-phosphate transferase
MIAFVLVFAVSLLLSLALTPVIARLGRRWGLVAIPDETRHHQGVIPQSGGIAMYFAFVIAILLIPLMPRQWMPPTPEGPDPKEIIRLAGVFFGATFLVLAGVWDDRKKLPAWTQFVLHLVAALIAMVFLIFIEVLNNPFTNAQIWILWPFPIFITLFWIMGMISTVNFLDGLDGLAASVTAITSAILTIHMISEHQYSVALLPLALLGSTLGFLPFNFHPAKVFMGSTGAYVLGYALGTLSIIAGARVATILLVMGIPIMDVAWQIYSRWRKKRAVGARDRGHLHYRLLSLGLSQRQIVGLYSLFSAVFGIMALLISYRVYKFFALLILGVLSLIMFSAITRRS